MTPEGELKAAVIDALNRIGLKHGYDYLRMQSGRLKVKRGFLHLHPEGTADFQFFPKGRVLWVELKAPGQKTAKERVEKQGAFALEMMLRGHEYARCETVDEVLEAIRGKV